jgi:hypothetical protein
LPFLPQSRRAAVHYITERGVRFAREKPDRVVEISVFKEDLRRKIGSEYARVERGRSDLFDGVRKRARVAEPNIEREHVRAVFVFGKIARRVVKII